VDGERRLRDFLRDRAVGGSGYSGAAAAIACRGRRIVVAAGWLDAERTVPSEPGDLFDLASLTKPWVATLALALDRSGALALESRVGDHWSGAPAHLASVPLEDLLRHRSGLRAWAPLYALCRVPEEVLDALADPRLGGAPPDTYSDLGFVLWRCLAELALGRSLDRLLAQRLGPLAVGLRSAPVEGANVSWCGLGTGKEVELGRELAIDLADLGPPPRGHAQDGNARFLGGLAGHAGLFGSVHDVLRLGEAWLHPYLLPAAGAVARALAGRGVHALGWRRTQPGVRGAEPLSSSSFGHTGFTGGSLWVDPARDLVVALVGHRNDPFFDLSPLRTALHRLAVEIDDAAPVRGHGEP
jgi:CubicO group peptidase (beta-lactamase class C family)